MSPVFILKKKASHCILIQAARKPPAIWAIDIPLAAAFLWGLFRVEGDGGKPLARAGLGAPDDVENGYENYVQNQT